MEFTNNAVPNLPYIYSKDINSFVAIISSHANFHNPTDCLSTYKLSN